MEELVKFGRKLVESGLTRSRFGNVSFRKDEDLMIISRRGSMLDELEGQLVEVPIFRTSELDGEASIELPMHRRIYMKTPASFVFHAHPLFAVVLSLLTEEREIKPLDSESRSYLERIPIIEGEAGSRELAESAAEILSSFPGAIIRGHGAVARGASAAEAYEILWAIEQACRIKYLVDLLRR